MDTLKIKAFLAVEKTGSFSKAAAEFSYTPSAFSHIADSLEAELGIKLFNRTHTGVEITEAGKKLKKKFKAVLEAEKSLFEEASRLLLEQENTLRIGAYSSIALHILPEILEDFKKLYPCAKTSIFVDDNLTDSLEEDKADIIFMDRKPNGDVKWCPIANDEYVAVVSADEFGGKIKIPKEELYNYPLIYIKERNLDGYFDFSAFRELVPLASIENSTALSMAGKNIGVAVLPEIAVKNHPEDVKILRLSPSVSRTIGFAYRKDALSEVGKSFVKYLEEKEF